LSAGATEHKVVGMHRVASVVLFLVVLRAVVVLLVPAYSD